MVSYMKCNLCSQNGYMLWHNLATGNIQILCQKHYFEYLTDKRVFTVEAFILSKEYDADQFIRNEFKL